MNLVPKGRNAAQREEFVSLVDGGSECKSGRPPDDVKPSRCTRTRRATRCRRAEEQGRACSACERPDKPVSVRGGAGGAVQTKVRPLALPFALTGVFVSFPVAVRSADPTIARPSLDVVATSVFLACNHALCAALLVTASVLSQRGPSGPGSHAVALLRDDRSAVAGDRVHLPGAVSTHGPFLSCIQPCVQCASASAMCGITRRHKAAVSSWYAGASFPPHREPGVFSLGIFKRPPWLTATCLLSVCCSLFWLQRTSHCTCIHS
jgi:hypothetical protein